MIFPIDVVGGLPWKMADLNLATINVNGIGWAVKRRALFNQIRKRKCGIAFLQETHSTTSQEKIWSSKWGGKAYFSHGFSGARGVTILFSPSLPIKILSSRQDGNGCFHFLWVSLDRWAFTLLNVYAPTADQPDSQVALLDEAEDLIHEFDCLNLFIEGDMNCCLDRERVRFSMDSSHSHHNRSYSERARLRLVDLIEGCQVWDIWRSLNHEEGQFTF